MEQKVNLPGLQAAVISYFQRLAVTGPRAPAAVTINNPVIWIYTGVIIHYQSWRGDQSAPPSGEESHNGEVPSGSEMESLLNQKLVIKERIRARVLD